MSRTAGDGFPLGDVEKDFMLDLIRKYSDLYLVDILGCCIMGTHLLVKIIPEFKFSDEDIKNRYVGFYGEDCVFTDGLISSLRMKLSNLSEFACEIKVAFARYYNRRHNRRGIFFLKPHFCYQKDSSKTLNYTSFNIYLVNFQLVNLV
jgi:hypothetical protein